MDGGIHRGIHLEARRWREGADRRRVPMKGTTTVATVLASLERKGNKRTREEMLPRYGITASKSWGVSVGDIRAIGKTIGRDHDLAVALWQTGWYEARMLCAFVDDPKLVTPKQMDAW